GVGVCASGTQTRTCDPNTGQTGPWGTCVGDNQPTPEVCDDGLDNDCDGQTDESCTNLCNGVPLTQSCGQNGPGVCTAGTQSRTCDPDTGQVSDWGACLGSVDPSPEICDGLDNDCDGTPDEGNPGGGEVCNTGLFGVCAAGATSCSSTGQMVCQQITGATAEVCGDNLDNDCDGVVDNGCQVACPNNCSDNGVCANGNCQCMPGWSGPDCSVPECSAGQSLCGGVCVDLQTDDNNCGACGNTCQPGVTACFNGVCEG
ncbi:MAG TPA: MopE-related protein, partial [Anaerolineales bacterium]|nr:MopE-related protein [Anaerolineales bacterium]